MVNKDKIFGMLVGCAYGDAMGMPSEMLTREKLNKAFPKGITKLESSSSIDFFGRNFKAGEVTDDTINTLFVCDSIINNNGKFDTEIYLNLLRRWVNDNKEKSNNVVGPSTQKALTSLDNGVPITKTGIYGTTNGSAMKVSPIGLISDYHDLNNLIDNVVMLCLPTHNTSIAIQGASIIAAIISYVANGGNDLEEIWNLAFTVIENCKDKGNQLPCASLSKRLQLIKQLIKEKEEEMLFELETIYGCGMETIETIPAVMAIITLSKLNPLKSALLSANLSGDSDTIGSISTAICGCANPSLISKEIIETLEKVNNIDFNYYTDNLFAYINKS